MKYAVEIIQTLLKEIGRCWEQLHVNTFNNTDEMEKFIKKLN